MCAGSVQVFIDPALSVYPVKTADHISIYHVDHRFCNGIIDVFKGMDTFLNHDIVDCLTAIGYFVALLQAKFFYLTGIGDAPISMNGTMKLAPSAVGTRIDIDGDLKATIPLIGGKIEKAAAPSIIKAMDKEQQTGTAWLKA